MVDDGRDDLPQTEPHPAPIFDTGPHPEPLESSSTPAADPQASEPLSLPDPSTPIALAELEGTGPPQAFTSLAYESVDEPPPAPAAPAQTVVVPGQYHYLQWWKLVLALLGVWIPAAAVGLGLYYWWVHDPSRYKTLPVLVTCVYVVVCVVGGLMLAMVPHRPLLWALAIAVMTAVFASTLAAAPLYGHYYCKVQVHQGGRCLAGILPY